MQPARIGAGAGTSRVGVQRRERGADGYDFLGEVPDGPIDPVVGVVRVDDLQGRPIAIMGAYGCHTVTVGPNAVVASPDYAGPLRRMVEQTLGGLCLFLQGGGGDIMPCWGMAYEVDGHDNKERVGTMLGAEVVRVASTIRTAVRRGDRVWTPSLNGPGLTMRPWVPKEGPTCHALRARTARVTLDLVELPPMGQALAIRAECGRHLQQAIADGNDRSVRIARRFAAWSDVLLHAVETGDRSRTVEIQALRINDIVLTGVAAEVFSATTRRIRDMSPVPDTIPLGYSNGVIGYLPTVDAYPVAGWNVADRYRVPDMVFQAYLLPTALAPDSEARVVDAVLGLISELA
jgi:neutral ceramidase